jgi:hypothetical protein
MGGLVAVTGSPGQSRSGFSGERALELIEDQVNMGSRVPGSEAHRRALSWMEGLLKSTGGFSFRQEWRAAPLPGDSLDLVNLIARYGPLRNGGILIGTHWDSRPWADLDSDPANHSRPVPGANDGASGTAVLLALAEILGRRPPPIPVTLVFFDAEDMGQEDTETDFALGSARFASNWPVDRPEVGLVIDMVCREGQLFDWEYTSHELAPDVSRLLRTAEQAAGVHLLSGVVGGALVDDHIPLIQAGLPTGLLIGIQDPDWHTVSDLPENCSARVLQDVGSLLLEIIYGNYLH